uniref:Uncharacterized protein n=1 Tax=Nosema pernyi TaxID=1112939 RepID=X5EM09_9MICR|nr:hypothetical protein NP_09C10 [Nosema pernyi]
MNSKNPIASTQFPKAYESMKKPKLNIPDLNTELLKDQELFYSYDTAVYPPPLSTTTCFVNETVNPDPCILRSSMYTVPNTSTGFDSLNIPLGIVLTPFASRANLFELNEKPIKCNQCSSFVSNFTRVEGSVFYCSLCKERNKLKYPIDTNSDIFKHPVIEYESQIPDQNTQNSLFVGDSFFNLNFIKTPVFLFVIDITQPALLEHTIKATVEVLSDPTFRCLYKKACVVLLSNKITLLKIEGEFVVTLDVVNSEIVPFIPPDVFFDTSLSTPFVDYLETIESINCTKIDSINFFNVILALTKYAIGSKVALFSSFYFPSPNLIANFVENSSSLSIFTTTNNKNTHNDVATYTMGGIFVYSPDQLYKIKADLHNICATKSVFGVKVSVKTSNAIRKNAIYANTLLDNLNQVDLPQMDANSTICFTFFVDEHVSTKEALHFQFVFEYYSYDGSYKTLVINTHLKTSDKPSEVYSSISFDTLFACLAKFISSDKKEAATHSKHVEDLICKFLSYYRKTCCREVSATQFVLPETAKLLPLLYQALIKNKSYSSTLNEIEMRRVTNLTVEQTLRYFYPRLFTLTDFYIQQDLTKIKSLNLSFKSLDSSEIYVLENSQKIFLYFGKDVDESLRDALFDDKEENAILMKIVNEICSNYGYELPIVVVEESRGSSSEVEFMGFMVEDTLNGVPSYHDYICELHFKVQKY